MGRLFGTDGVRGVAITEITCELAMVIGRAAAVVLTREMAHKPKIFIGKDTRISSDILEAAMISGICSVGADAHILGVIPTPAVAMLVRKYKGDAGVMISASHNSVEFNGIKLFSNAGYKLSDAIEEEIERLILDAPDEISLKSGTELGRITYDKNAEWDYVRYAMKTIPGDLKGIRVAIDCANGSASHTAEKLFAGLGATCYLCNCTPDGMNINDKCGSTHINGLMQLVREKHCQVGVAFDGDADRCLAVDENGMLIDGDKMLAIFAKSMNAQGKLRNRAMVATIMSNLGLTRFAQQHNVKLVAAKVGDRYVLEEMLAGEYNLGGEQSGHIIFLDDATTGDGQLSAVKLLSILKESEQKMSELADIMEYYPQVVINVNVPAEYKGKWQNDKEVTLLIEKSCKILGDDGRIIVRESGTEPLIRVMVEGKGFEVINACAVEVSDKIRDLSRKFC